MTAVTRVLGTLFTQKDPAPCPGLVPSCVEFTSGTIIWYVLWEILRSAGRDQNGLVTKQQLTFIQHLPCQVLSYVNSRHPGVDTVTIVPT